MKIFNKLNASWNGLVPMVSSAVRNWAPPQMPNEAKYRDHLAKHLRGVLGSDARVETEYRHAGTTFDIWVKWQGFLSSDEIAFELKVDLKRKSEFDRLVGQIEGIGVKKNKAIVVLIGDTSPAYLGRLEERYKEYCEGDGIEEPTMAILQVAVNGK